MHPKNDQLRGWDNAPNEKCYSSFGDCGTTATVNAYGNIIQFSTPIKEIASGIAVADHARMSEPYEVYQRTSEILEFSEESVYNEGTFGFYLGEIISNGSPTLTYVNYRWPRFEYPKNQEGISTTIQWAVHEGTVIQQCTIRNNGVKDFLAKLEFRTELCIRDVDFLNPTNHFNGGFYDIVEGYTDGRGPADSSWIRYHKLNGDSGYVAVAVSLFVDGKKDCWKDDLTWELPLYVDQSVDVVFAYKMVHTTFARPYSRLSISEEVAKVGSILRDEPFSNALRLASTTTLQAPDDYIKWPSGASTTTAAEHLEYLLHRNLEHILSVCAIPTTGFQGPGDDGDPRKELGVPIALTCGDVSFHRINTAASFFALQFIIESAKQIRSLPKDEKYDDYADNLVGRITTVCRGHLCWLLCTQKTASGLFAANYWIPGSIIRQGLEMSWLPNDSTTDTALQIIKIKACLEFLDISHAIFQPTIGEITDHWLDDLEKKHPRGAYVWPRSQETDTKSYRLNDNVWIWKALKDIELGQFLANVTAFPSPRVSKPSIALKKKDAYLDVQLAALRRFTMENSMVRRRMLAVSRSSRDTRFLFHSRDTVLLYAKDWGFILPETNFVEFWNNTLDVQRYHEDNQETNWDNALRYALSIAMACDGYNINRKSTSDLVKGSISVLVNSSSPNGLLMGELDGITKGPTLFSDEHDRDFYFHASFEIPFILLTKAKDVVGLLSKGSKSAVSNSLQKPSSPRDTGTRLIQNDSQPTVHIELANSSGDTLHTMETNDEFITDYAQKTYTGSYRMIKPMKKTIPFPDWVEWSNVVELGDEWLFNRPSFLSKDHDQSRNIDGDLGEILKDMEERGLLSDVRMKHAAEALTRVRPENVPSASIDMAFKAASLIDTQIGRVTVVDVGKKMKSKRHMGSGGWNLRDAVQISNAALWWCLAMPRTAKSAKKRFVWLRTPNHETALLSVAGSHVNERAQMWLFLNRHSHAQLYFFDYTTMYLNTWETEIHLSFYELIKPGNTSLVDGLIGSFKLPLPGLIGFDVAKASMGFRFVGDFFDKHWTCNCIDFLPGEVDPSKLWSHWDFDPSSADRSWTQRRVLELHLFHRMLTRLVESTDEIFSKLQTTFKHSWAEFAPMGLNERNYFQSSHHWQDVQNCLKVIADRLELTNEIIIRWESRQSDRGREQPRWTRSNEGKYRPTLNRLQVSTTNIIREFRSLHARINSTRESLITRQDQVRNEIAVQGSENIRFFTYVTVVFLPLGFAASIFSMSAVPDQTLVRNMVNLALVALTLTVVAVFSAKSVLGRIKWALHLAVRKLSSALSVLLMPVIHYAIKASDDRLQKSFFVQLYAISGPDRNAARPSTFNNESHSTVIIADQSFVRSVVNKLNSNVKEGSRPDNFYSKGLSWHAWFWILYLAIEFPARRVSEAIEALQRKNVRPSIIIKLIAGIIALPLWAVAFLMQLLALNIADLANLAWSSVSNLYSQISQQIPSDLYKNPTRASVRHKTERHMKALVTPGFNLRPFRINRTQTVARDDKGTVDDKSLL